MVAIPWKIPLVHWLFQSKVPLDERRENHHRQSLGPFGLSVEFGDFYSPAPNAGGEWLVGLDEFPVKRFYETED